MKLLTIIHKNFKLLLRSKSSAITVFIGPLLIISLILFTFSSSDELSFSIGVVDSEGSSLAADFIEELKSESYTVISYDLIETCIEDMKSSKTNLCLNFPENFELSGINDNPAETSEETTDETTDETNPSTKKQVEFYVDQSRINVVESIMFSVGSNIESKSEEITDERTKEILSEIGKEIAKIKSSQEESSSNIEDKIEGSINDIESNSNQISSKASDMETDLEDSVENIESADEGLTELDDSYTILLEQVNALMGEVNSLSSSDESLEAEYDELDSILDTEGEEIETSITALESAISNLEKDIESSYENAVDVADSSEVVESQISEISTKIDDIKEELSQIKESVARISSLSGQSVENEFEIVTKEIVSSSDKSLFMFPYYLVLLILFVGMMLSSNLVVIEKQSMAFFRNYTSPTSSLMHLLARYVTNLTILTLQVAAVLVSVYFYLKIPIFENYKVTLTILFLTISLFVFLGYLLGQMFKTQEGITIAFISVGSVFAFLSNLILPIESFSYTIRSILMYNPYMLTSELLKKSMIFNSGFVALGQDLIVLAVYLFVVILLVLVFQKISVSRFSLGEAKKSVLKRPHITEDKKFRFEEGFLVEDIESLTNAIKDLNKTEFDLYTDPKNNEFAYWVKTVFKEKKLAKKLKKATNKGQALKALEEHLNPKK